MEQYYKVEEIGKNFIERKYNARNRFNNYQISIDFFSFFYHSRD